MQPGEGSIRGRPRSLAGDARSWASYTGFPDGAKPVFSNHKKGTLMLTTAASKKRANRPVFLAQRAQSFYWGIVLRSGRISHEVQAGA